MRLVKSYKLCLWEELCWTTDINNIISLTETIPARDREATLALYPGLPMSFSARKKNREDLVDLVM